MRARADLRDGTMSGGALVISLDFELHWGVRDLWTVDQYRPNLLGVRAAVPALLSLFEEFGIHATWAPVGLLFFESRDEMLATLPERLPAYAAPHLSPYAALAEVGESERDDPFHFAPSLIRRIADTPAQEIGTHTFSHYFCLEPGQTVDEFRADLETACAVARAKIGRAPESIVFPRNQMTDAYLAVCGDLGLAAYRGNQDHWAYRARPHHAAQSPALRAVRLADAYVPLSGMHASHAGGTSALPVDVPASRYLRPYLPALRRLEPLRLRRINTELEHAAATGGVYHLWWHPHDFGIHLNENLAFLRRILACFARLRESRGMASLTMAEAGRRLAAPAMLPERRAPQRALVVDHFAAAAPYWRDIYASPDVQGTIYRERRATAVGLADGLGLPLGSRVLEIGCGAGSAAIALAQRGYVIHALDRVPTMIDLTRRLAVEAGVVDRIVASLGDLHHLGFADGRFDLVLALGVTPWLDALEEPLRELRRVLRPGGHLIVSADNLWRLNAILDPRWFPALAPLRARARRALNRVRRRPPTAGVRMYAITEFDRLLEASGLRKLHGRTLGFGPFSLFNLPLVSEPRGVRVHHALQRLADRGTPLLRAAGSHYLVVAQRVPERAAPALDPEATTHTFLERQACR